MRSFTFMRSANAPMCSCSYNLLLVKLSMHLPSSCQFASQPISARGSTAAQSEYRNLLTAFASVNPDTSCSMLSLPRCSRLRFLGGRVSGTPSWGSDFVVMLLVDCCCLQMIFSLSSERVHDCMNPRDDSSLLSSVSVSSPVPAHCVPRPLSAVGIGQYLSSTGISGLQFNLSRNSRSSSSTCTDLLASCPFSLARGLLLGFLCLFSGSVLAQKMSDSSLFAACLEGVHLWSGEPCRSRPTEDLLQYMMFLRDATGFSPPGLLLLWRWWLPFAEANNFPGGAPRNW
mmetsp:Transcript_4674/g.14126  ORF Transcript_4674/g.14126 Transcript_4674/m.14126 type:complete len:286 (+) Transcript_4674:2378-3235(+)